MGTLLPYVLMAFSALALFGASVSLWRSFKGIFGTTASFPNLLTDDRASLLEEKHALLISLKDLAFERDLGKLSEADFKRLEQQYRQRAYAVMHALDEDIESYRQQAEQLVAEHQQPGEHS